MFSVCTQLGHLFWLRCKSETLNQCFSFLMPVFAYYQCLCLRLLASLCLHFFSQTSVSLAFVPYLLHSAREHSLPSTYRHFGHFLLAYLLVSHLPCLLLLSLYFLSFIFTSFKASPRPPQLPFLYPLLPLHLLLLLRSHFHLSMSLCCLFDRGAVFSMKAVSKSPNHREAQDSDTPKV